MIVNNVPLLADCETIINDLKSALALKNIPLLNSIRDTPDNVMVSCIYHKNGQERKPSAGIKKDTGVYHCFACGEIHDMPEFISNCFGYNDFGNFGWQWLNRNYATVSVEERKGIELDIGRNTTTTYTNHNYISEEELDSYRYIHPYMYKRKLTDEVIEIFDIGYDKRTECITFPIRDISGNTLFIARRSVNTKFFNYPQGVEKPVYGLYELSKIAIEPARIIQDEPHAKIMEVKGYPTEIIICESMLDALTCWVYGKYAVALNGLGNELQFEQLNNMPCRKFILATDMDEAGKNARERIRANVKHRIVTEYIWDVNVAKDINDMSREMFDNLEEVF